MKTENPKHYRINHDLAAEIWEVLFKEGYPFIALPIAVGLNSDTKTYETSLGLTGGWTGRVPLNIQQLSKLTASLELNVGLKDTYTGLFMGLSYPIN